MTIADVDLDAIRTPVSRNPDLWCGEAVLESFGTPQPQEAFLARFGAGVASCLQADGYTVERAEVPWRPKITLGRFITEHPTGDWVIGTSGHVMSLRDGKLTDTDERGTGRRRVELAYQVTRP
jgi:hypothetical protein